MASKWMNIGRDARLLLVLPVLGLELGCRATGERSAPNPGGDAACASACAAFVTGCPSDEPTDTRQAACVARCRDAARRAERAGCAAEHRAYLGCASTARIECRSAAEPAGTTLDLSRGVIGCEAAHEKYYACTEPCREQGVVRTGVARLDHAGRELSVRAELVNEGCTEPLPRKAKGSAPGSRCTHHSVCGAERCACGPGRPGYLARACIEERCATRAEACALAPRAVAYRPCR